MKPTCIVLSAGMLFACIIVAGEERPKLTLGAEVQSRIWNQEFVGLVTPVHDGLRVELDAHQTSVRLFGPNGNLLRVNEVNVPGAESVTLVDGIASKSGLEAVTGTAVNAAGATTGVIELFDQSGPAKLVIRTSPFVPTKVAIAPDGFIWAIAYDQEVEFGNPPATPERKKQATLLRKYSPDGVLAGSFLPRSNFARRVYPWVGNHGGHVTLRASAEGIGLYVPHDDGSGDWFELSLAGEFKGHWALDPPGEGLAVIHVAFPDSGAVYAEWHSTDGRLTSGTYKLDKSANAWASVVDPQAKIVAHGSRAMRPALIGEDGDLLLFMTSYQPNQVTWFREGAK